MTEAKIRVLLVDDQQVLREGLCLLYEEGRGSLMKKIVDFFHYLFLLLFY